MSIEIDIIMPEDARRALGAVIAAARNLRPVLLEFGEHTVTSIQENFLRGGRPAAWKESWRAEHQGGKTLIMRGHLRESIHPQVEGDHTLRVGTNRKYARVQHFGTVGAGGTLPDIVPRNEKFLTIPLPGVTRGARTYANTFVLFRGQSAGAGRATATAGHGMIFQRVGKTGKGKPKALFILRKRVALPPRPFLVIQREDWDYLAQSAGDYLSDAFKEP